VRKMGVGKKALLYIGLIILTIVWLIPFIWAITTSLKPGGGVYELPPKLIFEPVLDNYLSLFHHYGFTQYLINSLIVGISSTILCLALGLPAAYAFARFDFRGREGIAKWILSLRMFPPIAVVIPFYLISKSTGLYGSLAAVILIHTVFNLPFVIWLMIQFILDLPKDIEDAYILDGYSRGQAFIKVTLPLSAPGLVTSALFALIFSWNEYLFALTLTFGDTKTLPVAITFFLREYGLLWGELAAAVMITIVPVMIFALLIQRYIVRGLTFGAVR